jgi:hypothetical protein
MKSTALGFYGGVDRYVKENCFLRIKMNLRKDYGRNYKILSFSEDIRPTGAREERYWMWKLMKKDLHSFRDHAELLDSNIIYDLEMIIET